jgi:hypothetical protein
VAHRVILLGSSDLQSPRSDTDVITVDSHHLKTRFRGWVTLADPHLVPVLSVTVVLLVAFAFMFFVPYAVLMDPNGTDPGYGNNYLHDSMTLFAIAGLFAVLDILAIRRARHLFRMRPSVVILADDPTYHRSILNQEIPLGVVASAAWITLTTMTAVVEGSWLQRLSTVCIAIALAASVVARYRRPQARAKELRPGHEQQTATTASVGVEEQP